MLKPNLFPNKQDAFLNYFYNLLVNFYIIQEMERKYFVGKIDTDENVISNLI